MKKFNYERFIWGLAYFMAGVAVVEFIVVSVMFPAIWGL